jgi:hypothetical protein
VADDRIQEVWRGYAEDDFLGSAEPPDLGPLRAVAEGAELAEPVSRLAGAYGRPLAYGDPLAPLARDIARALTEAGFTLHHCAQSHPLYRLSRFRCSGRWRPCTPGRLAVEFPASTGCQAAWNGGAVAMRVVGALESRMWWGREYRAAMQIRWDWRLMTAPYVSEP